MKSNNIYREIESLEDDQTFARWSSLFTVTNQDSVARSKDSESIGFAIFPLAVDVLSMSDVDEGEPVDLIVPPMRNVESEVIVDEDAQAVPLALRVHFSLVLAVAEVSPPLHFNIKIISVVCGYAGSR